MAISEKKVECDLLVIGGGLAGTHAAIRARQLKDLDVVLVDKGYVSMSGSLAPLVFTGMAISISSNPRRPLYLQDRVRSRGPGIPMTTGQVMGRGCAIEQASGSQVESSGTSVNLYTGDIPRFLPYMITRDRKCGTQKMIFLSRLITQDGLHRTASTRRRCLKPMPAVRLSMWTLPVVLRK